MSTPLFIQLGRLGDILAILPLLYADFQKTGARQKLMVAQEFSKVLTGCSYIDPIIFDGDYRDLDRAVFLARGMTDNVIVTSLHGSTTAVAKHAYGQIKATGRVTSSFQKEAWNLAGRLNQWDDNLPLVFDARDPEREKRLLDANGILRARKPILLLALGGVTAGFEHADLLRDYVHAKFDKTYRVIDLPMTEDGHCYDLLAVMERAALLITTDSMPLHLAWACRSLPVFALTNDRSPDGKLSLWHGSPWRPNHLWYCRYSDWPARAQEMMEVISKMGDKQPEVARSVRAVRSDRVFGPNWNRLPITRGMCSRELNGAPFVKDAVRMAMQRANADDWIIQIARDYVRVNLSDARSGGSDEEINTKPHAGVTARGATFAYRQHKGTHIPIIDLFSAPKSFWKTILPEVPDLLLDNSDPWWSEALLAVFKKHGAVNASGCCEFVGKEEAK